MDPNTALSLLLSYKDKKRGMLEASFVESTIDYIRVEVAQGRGATALKEPSVVAYIQKAQLAVSCGWPVFDRPTISTNTVVVRPAVTATATATPILATTATTTTAAAVAVPVSLTLYCDGSCIGNGRRGARAGYAVVAMRGGVEEHRFVARIPDEEAQTNQRAELRALDYAVRYVAGHGRRGTIHTDSDYSIKCVTQWASSWEKKGWKKADGGPVLHLDIIRPLVSVYRELPNLTIRHVAAHTGRQDEHSRGNALVDELARESVS
jgi:ribonuclease HI